MALLKYMEVWIGAVRHIPALSIAVLPEILKALGSTLPFSLYMSVLASLSYSVRRNIKAPVAITTLFLFSLALHAGFGLLLDKAMPLDTAAPKTAVTTLGNPGLMLNQGSITMILLDDPAKPGGSRVVSIPGQALIYQEKPLGPGNSILPLPDAPLQNDLPYFLKSIMMDFSLTAKYYQGLLTQGLIPFLIYSACICFLLCSLRFLFTVSRWPLANIFLGALVFRGILTMETFLHSGDTLEFIKRFIGERIPPGFIVPAILAVLGLLVVLYTVLAYFARGRRTKNE